MKPKRQFPAPDSPSFTDRPFGAPLDDYCGQTDMAESIKFGLAAIRERKAKGGPGWNPTPAAQSAPPVGAKGKGRPEPPHPVKTHP